MSESEVRADSKKLQKGKKRGRGSGEQNRNRLKVLKTRNYNEGASTSKQAQEADEVKVRVFSHEVPIVINTDSTSTTDSVITTSPRVYTETTGSFRVNIEEQLPPPPQ